MKATIEALTITAMNSQPLPEPATERQIAYIEGLGGKAAGLTIEQASALIDKLKQTKPPTVRQIEAIKKFGATVPESLTYQQALDLLGELDRKSPPTPKQKKLIKMLGGELPQTKEEAKQLCEKLEKTAPATEHQINEIKALGKALPDGATYADANQFLEDMERDADGDEGQPPGKDQISRIIKLGGDPAKAINNWRAEEYIEKLEEQKQQFEDRVENAIDFYFSDREATASRPVRKPSKKVMEQALNYGDAQGWGAEWEMNHEHMFNLLDFALYTVAPLLIKPGWALPLVPANMITKAVLPTPEPEQVKAESTPCPYCASAILASALREGSNKCPSCEKSFIVKYD